MISSSLNHDSSARLKEAQQLCQRALRQLRGGDPAAAAGWTRDHLFTQVLPFWDGLMDEKGGIITCVKDSGEVVNTDKWLWSQWRAVWVFSRIYRTLDRDRRWLERAQAIAEFCLKTGWLDDADGWALVVSREGHILRSHESIYVDAFAVYGLAELYAASGDKELLRWAKRTADAALKKLAQPYDTLPHFPYPIPPGAKPHGIPMLWSFTLAELGAVSGETRYLDAARALSNEIFCDHYRPDRNVFLESVRLDGKEFPPPVGTAVVPGHVVEDMWFQWQVSRLVGLDPKHVEKIFPAVLRHLQLGWDERCGGGLLLAVDADGHEPVGWNYADTKLWWPQTEALYAVLLGWKQTGNPDFMDWYQRIWNLCLERFVDWEHGEWRQKLDRSLCPMTDVVALPVKDPFHLPRSLIMQIELLEGGLLPVAPR
jgi:N-acylglucosamine 2-epimerase